MYLTVPEESGNGYISKRAIIELGKTQGDIVEVISGLKEGDQIVLEGARSVRDNQQVNVLDSTKTAKK